MPEINCDKCGAPINEDQIVTLKIQQKVECSFCGNVIHADMERDTIKDQLSCIFCGGPIKIDESSGKATCEYCAQTAHEVTFNEIYYPELFDSIRAIPYEKVIEAFRNLMDKIDELPPEEQEALRSFGEDFVENIKEIYKAAKWPLVKQSITWLGKGIGTLIGMATVGGALGGAIGYFVSLVGTKFLKQRIA